MLQFAVKVLVTALVVVAISEVARRSTFWAAALASLPLTSILAFVWMHVEGVPSARIASMGASVFWLVIPSLLLFVIMPALMRAGWAFWPSLAAGCAATAGAYAGVMAMLARWAPAS